MEEENRAAKIAKGDLTRPWAPVALIKKKLRIYCCFDVSLEL